MLNLLVLNLLQHPYCILLIHLLNLSLRGKKSLKEDLLTWQSVEVYFKDSKRLPRRENAPRNGGSVTTAYSSQTLGSCL